MCTGKSVKSKRGGPPSSHSTIHSQVLSSLLPCFIRQPRAVNIVGHRLWQYINSYIAFLEENHDLSNPKYRVHTYIRNAVCRNLAAQGAREIFVIHTARNGIIQVLCRSILSHCDVTSWQALFEPDHIYNLRLNVFPVGSSRISRDDGLRGVILQKQPGCGSDGRKQAGRAEERT
jgi:hypothetical protein